MRKKREELNPIKTVHKTHHRFILRYLFYSVSVAVSLRELSQAMATAGFKHTGRQDIHNYLLHLRKMSLVFKRGRNNYFLSKKGEKLLDAYKHEKETDRLYKYLEE